MPRGGKRPGSGRKKGGTNKVTADVKQAIMEAFSALGGAKYLCAVAREDPKAFCTLLGKLIPVKVAGDENNPLAPTVMVDRPPQETREQWLARRHRELGLTPPSTHMIPAAGASDPHFASMRIWTGAGSRLEGGGAPGRRCGLAGVQGVPNPGTLPRLQG